MLTMTPALMRSKEGKKDWIPAFAGMTEGERE
jgi:hypothetical protein